MTYITKEIYSFSEAISYLSVSKSFLYKLTSQGVIPHYKPSGKLIYFKKEDLDSWLLSNPIKVCDNFLTHLPL